MSPVSPLSPVLFSPSSQFPETGERCCLWPGSGMFSRPRASLEMWDLPGDQKILTPAPLQVGRRLQQPFPNSIFFGILLQALSQSSRQELGAGTKPLVLLVQSHILCVQPCRAFPSSPPDQKPPELQKPKGKPWECSQDPAFGKTSLWILPDRTQGPQGRALSCSNSGGFLSLRVDTEKNFPYFRTKQSSSHCVGSSELDAHKD